LKNISPRHLICALAAAAAAFGPATTLAQAYPARPITLVVPFSAGSGTDQIARAMAQAIAAEWKGATLVVDNKPGAGGAIAAQAVARAQADGYTLFLTTNTTQSANPHLFKKLSYNPVADFAPVAALVKGAMVLAVPAASPVKSVTEFIALARRKTVNFGAGNSSSRVAGELFKQMTGVDLVYIPYKSNPQAVTDLVGGQLDAMFADTATTLPLIQSGRLRALAYTGHQRAAVLPAVPTLDESGVKGYELTYWVAAYAPRGTPADIVRRLNEVFNKATRSESATAVFAQAIVDVFSTTPEGLAEFQRAETEKWGRVIKGAGIEPE
jgi:tripartite-type tricarboxylate transporter receptor subunit TctC